MLEQWWWWWCQQSTQAPHTRLATAPHDPVDVSPVAGVGGTLVTMFIMVMGVIAGLIIHRHQDVSLHRGGH